MKPNLNFKTLIICLLVMPLAFISCDDDDDKINYNTDLVGIWNNPDLSMDNQALSGAVSYLITTQVVKINEAEISFDDQGNFGFSMPDNDGTPIQLSAKYAYLNDEVALRFDQVIPIPFNAFKVTTLTNTNVTFVTTLSPLVLTGILELVKREDAEIGTLIEGLLNASMENGLTITIQLQRKN